MTVAGRGPSRVDCDCYFEGDLTDYAFVENILSSNDKCFDEIYVYASVMGGAGFLLLVS